MKLIVFRHAEKDLSEWTPNPGLSFFGEQQAETLCRWVEQKKLPTPTQIWASPKKRTSLTMQPLSECLNQPIQIKIDLEERQSHESAANFRGRIQKTIEELEKLNEYEIVFLCSHSDWLDDFSTRIESNLDLTKTPELNRWLTTQWAYFEKKSDSNNHWTLIKIGRIGNP